jgi:hypothetical protein
MSVRCEHRRARHTVLLVLKLVSVGALIGFSTSGAAEEAPLVFAIDEKPFVAELAGIDAEWNLTFKTADKLRVIAAGDLSYFGRYRDQESGPQLVLVDGSVLRTDLLHFDGQKFVIGDASGLGRGLWEESALSRAAVKAVMWQPPAGRQDRDKLLRALNAYVEPKDRLLLVGEEAIAGTIVRMPRAVRFANEESGTAADVFEFLPAGDNEAVAIPEAKVIAASFGVAPPEPTRSGRPEVWLGMSDGSLIRARSIGVKGDTVTVGLSCGGELHMTPSGRQDRSGKSWREFSYIEPVNSRIQWLSDLPPIGYKHIPFLSIERPFGSDENVVGFRLRASGAVVRKGLGMPSASRLAYDVVGYRKFEAEIAIDEEAELQGSVVFKVLLERSPGQWQPAFESPVVRGGDAPLAVSVDLKGASRLALLVEFADRGDECDWGNWLHARFTK